MKVIKFEVLEERNIGTEDALNIIRDLVPYEMGYTEQNYQTACAKAYNGEVVVEDDGQPEPPPTEQEQLRADVDFLLAMGGVL